MEQPRFRGLGDTTTGYGIAGLIVLILDVIAILGVLQSNLDAAKKLIWILVILLLPVIGMILWFLIGAKT